MAGLAERPVVFGFGADATDLAGLTRTVRDADRLGLDHFSVSDHPYLANYLDAYASLGFLLGQTSSISGFVNVTNLPTRPPALLARTLTSLAQLSSGRIALGIGAGGRWNRIADLGVPPLSPAAAVEAFEEGISLIRLLSTAGPAVTFAGRYYSVSGIKPVPAAFPIWTGSVGPRSLAATGRVADGWIPGHGADWLSPRYRQGRPMIDDAALAAGRVPGDIRTIFNLPGLITVSDLRSPRDDEGRWVGGSARQWTRELTRAVIEFGASGFTVFSKSYGAMDDAGLRIWAEEIAPAVREATVHHF